jgi:hypothetical protein
MLTQEILREHFKYDPDTGHLFWIKPSLNQRRNLIDPAGFRDKDGYLVICSNLSGIIKNYRVHRLIWVYVYGQISNQIDHINGVRNDNRLCNLREVTHQQNMMNRPKHKSSNKFRGVYASANKRRWIAQISVNSSMKYIGSFDTPEEASFAYEKVRSEMFKEFART